jgi:hypothetical protein
MGPVNTTAIALNASRKLASDLPAFLGQDAATPLKTALRMGVLLSLSSESGEWQVAAAIAVRWTSQSTRDFHYGLPGTVDYPGFPF